MVRVRFLKNNLLENRFFLAASSQVSKQATARNLLKRRARAIARKKIKLLPPGRAVLFIFSKKDLALSYAELEAELTHALLSL